MMHRSSPFVIASLVAIASSFAAGVSDVRADARGVNACAPLRIEPARLRVATDSAASLHAVGGSGRAIFTLEGELRGASIEAGGGVRAGDRAATFTAVARDGTCGAEARAAIDVVGPFAVSPRSMHLPLIATAKLTAHGALGEVTYAVLDSPPGAGRALQLRADGSLAAGERVGTYHLVARDSGSGREVPIVVDVGKAITPLHARASFFAVPAGGKIALAWDGGSGDVAASVAPESGGRIAIDDGVTWFDAHDAKPGIVDVRAIDGATHEEVTTRVLVGRTLGAPPIVRGTQSGAGDLASGDLNGDGRADLVIGHAERSRVGLEAGGILVFYGDAHGAFAQAPDLVIDGERAGDRFGSVVLVRDMNGDGIDDLVAGVPDRDLGESDRGSLAIYLGSKDGLTKLPERVLSGEDAGQRFGSAIALGDLTGDGVPDLVVSAPNAKSPFAKGCEGGRAYVYRSRPGVRGVVEAVPWQTIELRDPLSDAPESIVPCSTTALAAGRALALVDMDGDRVLDLAVGAPFASYPQPNKGHGAVDVYRGLPSGMFAATPTWAIHLDPSQRADYTEFGAGLDVIGGENASQVLVVRAPKYAPRGGNALGALWTFALGSLGAPLAPIPGTIPQARVRVVTTHVASAMLTGTSPGDGIGRSATLADVDGDGKREYVVGCAAPAAPGRILIFSEKTVVSAHGTFAPTVTLALPSNELAGFRVVGLRGAANEGAGLASFAAWRTTAMGPFAGAVDYVAPASSPIATRWRSLRSIPLPNFGASDRAGTSVALASGLGARHTAGDAPIALVGAPGAHSPAQPSAAPPRIAGDRLRTGAIDSFADDGAERSRIWVDRNDAQIGNGPLVTLDFDGDGALDVAVGDPNESSTAPLASIANDPDACLTKGDRDLPGRGAVRVYSWIAGAFVERFRVVAPPETERADNPKYVRARFGSSLAAADVNGDGKDDLIVGRPGSRDASGVDVVLGRKGDPKGKLDVACHRGESGPFGSTALPSATPDQPIAYGVAVAGIGDLDHDGCAEIAASMTRGAYPGNGPRAGIVVAFGYDASGAHCSGHRAPFLLRIVPDDHALASNVVGNVETRLDDVSDLRGAPTGMGTVLARGSGDVTGDGIADLVFRDADLARGETRGPAVEIVSGAYLASLCPGHACAKGLHGSFYSDGDWHVLGLRTVPFPQRRIVQARQTETRFGSAIALADLTGDGIAELAIGVADGAYDSPFAGEVRIHRGGKTIASEGAANDPWLIAVGDARERSGFGSSIATARATSPSSSGGWLLAGAPLSNRNGSGGDVGAAYLWKIPVNLPESAAHGSVQNARNEAHR